MNKDHEGLDVAHVRWAIHQELNEDQEVEGDRAGDLPLGLRDCQTRVEDGEELRLGEERVSTV